MDKAEVRFWGVRGTIAVPHRYAYGVGGNTPCLEVRWRKQLIILDAGTGIRALGTSLVRRHAPVRGAILFSHVHLDHTAGLPFFQPCHDRRSRLLLAGPKVKGASSFRSALFHAFQPPSFPVRLGALPMRARYRTLSRRPFWIGRIRVFPFALHHPGGALGYRLQFPHGHSIVYATDSEPKSAAHAAAMARWMAGADVLIHDGQYTPEEYQRKIGWGHSPYTYPLELAARAHIPRVFLFHHGPGNDDRSLARFVKAARSFVRRQKWNVQCDLAREGQVIKL